MADLDELQIKISSSSKDAEKAIDTLIDGLERLNSTLSKLDVSKVNSFANSMQKLANIGANTNTTAKALKGIANEISSSFGIRTKKGVEDVTIAIQALYNSARNLKLNDSPENQNVYFNTIKGLQKAIEANYKYKEAVDDTTKSIADYVKAQNKSGQKIAMGDMAKEYGEDFQQIAKVLGKSFNNKLLSTQDATDLAKFFEDMNAALNTSFKTGNDQELKQSLDDLVHILENAKDKVYDFSDAVSSGLLSGEEAANAAYNIADRLFALIREQDKYGASSGLGGLVDVFKQISNIQMPDMTGMADVLKAVQASTSGMGETAPKVENVAESIGDISESASQALPSVVNLQTALENISNIMSNMRGATNGAVGAIEHFGDGVKMIEDKRMAFVDSTGEWVDADDVVDPGEMKQAAEAVNDVADAVNNVNENLNKEPKGKHGYSDVLSNIVELGEGFETLSKRLDGVAEKGVKLYSTLMAPLKHVAEEYKEKFEHMGESVSNFVKETQAKLTKLAAFWKRIMRTFTFMVVRKAITAIIKEVGNAIQSLAMFSNAMGTQFNPAISNLVADFQYLGRSIVSVFAPLVEIIAPIIDAIVAKIATLLTYIGMLFSLIGGKTTFTKAKKNVGNYAESLDKASKSAKNLTMGIDELNIISETESGGGSSKPFDGWEDAWEDIDIPQWLKDLWDWLKDLFKRFWDPIKEAWDRAKQYVIDGFKTMIDALARLLWHMLDDFLTMWNQEKTIRMLEQVFRIIGDIFRVVRNLANQFDKAWEKGKVGLHIFENLRDILATIVDHIRNVTYYMIGWASGINFSPMLETFEELTRKMVRLADFLGGIFEDIMIEGVLKYIEFIIEDAIPHMNETLSSILDSFSFNKLRENLKPVWAAIEEMLEQIHIGITNTIGNIGRALGEFTASKAFTDFLQRLVDVSKLITAERVEKVLTALAESILDIAKAVIKFVNSKPFMKFLQAIAEWIDKKSVKDIANVLDKIAAAIIGFKFAAFATEKLAGFFKFFAVITALRNIKTIASELNILSGAIEKSGKAASAVKITSYAEGFKKLGENIYLLPTKIGELAAKFLDLHNHIGLITKSLGSLFVGFEEFKHVSSSVEELSYSLMSGNGLNGALLELIATVGIAAAAFTALLGFPAGIIAAGVVGAIAAIKGIQEAIDQINFEHISDAILTQGEMTVAQVKEWYEQTTSLVTEHAQKWIDTSRNLIQANADMQEYLRTIGDLSGALEGQAEATVLMIDILAGKYEDLRNCIDNYVNESTESLVSNLLAQKAYLESQGFDVDQMILDIYQTAETTKNAVDESTEKVKGAAQAYSDAVEKYGYGSEEAKKALDEYKKATDEATKATDQFNHILGDVKTEEAVREIKELGKSIDFSQYSDPQEAITALQNAIDDIKSAYISKMGELEEARDQQLQSINEAFQNGLITEETKAAAIAQTNKDFAEMSDAVSTATNDALDLFQGDLLEKIENVGKEAEKTWEAGAPEIAGLTKAEYVNQQIQEFLNMTLGKDGLEGSINKIYDELPGNVNNNVVTAMQGIVNDQWDAYINASSENGTYSDAKARQFDMMQGILNQADGLDYDTPASTFANNAWNTIMNYAKGIQYDEFGRVVIGGAATSILTSKQEFEDANRLASGEGAMAFSDEYKQKIAPLAESMGELGLDTGKNFDLGFVNGIRSSDEQNGLKAEIDNLFNSMKNWIHDNPFMPFGSPNKKTEEYGKDIVLGFNLGITANAATSNTAISTWFAQVNATLRNEIDKIKTTFNTLIVTVFSGQGADVTSAITTLFTNVTTLFTTNLELLGTILLGTLLPTFMQTYIFPFFDLEMWQPILDNLMNAVFIPNFELFTTWFTESMTVWWEDGLLFWFTDDKWNEDVFTPLANNIHDHWNTFSVWWDTTMNAWWNNQVKPWFLKDKWIGEFNHILEAAKETFEQIKNVILEKMKAAEAGVIESCNTMKAAIQDVIAAIGEMMDAMSAFEGFQGEVTFAFGAGKFAAGGYPSRGSLFWAGEAGPELLGTVGGKTAVASNDEITGIASAVYSTGNEEAQLLSQLISIGQAMLNKDPVVISDKDIARMNNSGQSKLGLSIIS